MTIAKIKAASLTLLKVKALKAALKVPTRVAQKLMSMKEVRPMSSHPKSKTNMLPERTKRTILQTKAQSIRINLSTLGSYLKYAKA